MVMLVSSIRRAERLALAMDARGFDSGIRRTISASCASAGGTCLTVAVALAVAAAALGHCPR